MNKKPRDKKHRPKPALVGGGLQALVRIEERSKLAKLNATPFRIDDLNDLSRVYWAAFGKMKAGDNTNTKEACEYVTASINMALLLCEDGFGEEHVPLMIRAQEALFKAQLRGKRTGNYRFDGPGLIAVSGALEIHDVQMQHATPSDISKAEDELARRIRDGNVYELAAA